MIILLFESHPQFIPESMGRGGGHFDMLLYDIRIKTKVVNIGKVRAHCTRLCHREGPVTVCSFWVLYTGCSYKVLLLSVRT